MKPRCKCAIYVRDCLRRTGRGRGGFSMHYEKRQCSRAAIDGSEFCKVHTKQSEYMSLETLDWHPFMESK